MLVIDLGEYGVWVLPRGVSVSSGQIVVWKENLRRALAVAFQARTVRKSDAQS